MTPARWLAEPEEHDFPAAADYLSLVLEPALVTTVVDRLRAATTVHYKAKDLLRASRLALLDEDNAHVAKDLKKLRDGEALSPVLLVRGDLATDAPLTIADGYHRVCASYWVDENIPIPARLVSLTTH